MPAGIAACFEVRKGKHVLDVLVIGSGYGGSVIAARLAPRCRVLVVERGRWWRSGELPVGVADLCRAYCSARNPGGLWGMRFGRGTGVAFASAVGGSSPVNYGITSRPDDHALDGWPISASELAPWYEAARAVLRPEANPRADRLGDKNFLDVVEPGRRVDLENTIDWDRCNWCGRCVPGCNAGAKRSLDQTYLALALRAGAELRPQTVARDLVRLESGGYAVELRTTDGGETDWVHARTVVLAAGALGTLDLVQRAHFAVGPMFGQRISLNGDALAFLYDTAHPVSSHSGAPISTSARIPFVDDDGRVRTLTVMSGRVPRVAMRLAAAALAVGAGTVGKGDPLPGRALRRLRDLAGVAARGAMSHSFMYKLDGQDEARGTARFTSDGVVVDWEDYADDPILRFAEERLRAWAEVAGGLVIPNLARLVGRGFSVHPLGGCRMGATIADGVVDGFGRVFDPRGGVHDGLRIADGSIVPGALGVPPSWTIAALAERIADQMLQGAPT